MGAEEKWKMENGKQEKLSDVGSDTENLIKARIWTFHSSWKNKTIIFMLKFSIGWVREGLSAWKIMIVTCFDGLIEWFGGWFWRGRGLWVVLIVNINYKRKSKDKLFVQQIKSRFHISSDPNVEQRWRVSVLIDYWIVPVVEYCSKALVVIKRNERSMKV